MSEQEYFLGSYTRLFKPTMVTPVLGAFRVSPDAPPPYPDSEEPEPPEGMLPLTFWMGGRAVASRWYPVESFKEIRESALFADVVSLAFDAVFPGATPGWMRVDLGAVGQTSNQVWSLLQLFRDKPGCVPLLHAGFGRVGLHLGHHWVSIPWEIAERLSYPDDESYARAGAFAEEAFKGILLADEDEGAVRLLESIPGIRGERAEIN
jgi:hypothetical protein